MSSRSTRRDLRSTKQQCGRRTPQQTQSHVVHTQDSTQRCTCSACESQWYCLQQVRLGDCMRHILCEKEGLNIADGSARFFNLTSKAVWVPGFSARTRVVPRSGWVLSPAIRGILSGTENTTRHDTMRLSASDCTQAN